MAFTYYISPKQASVIVHSIRAGGVEHLRRSSDDGGRSDDDGGGFHLGKLYT